MGLYLGLIRLAIVLSNVYWSFKTLKPPRLNRRGDAPVARAVATRKREIKACLSVWVIWACWIHAERLCDTSIGVLIPFYDDLKALFLTIFFLCRAAVAEPLLLHFLRPLIKPYIVSIDWALEIFTILAGLIIRLVCLPVNYLQLWLSPDHPEEAIVTDVKLGESRYVPINVVDETHSNTRQPVLPSLTNGPRTRARSNHALPDPRVAQVSAAPANQPAFQGMMTRRRGKALDEDEHPFERRHVVVPPTRTAPPRPQPSFEIPFRNRMNASGAAQAEGDQFPLSTPTPISHSEVPIKHPLQSSRPPSRSRDLPTPSVPPITVQHTYPPVSSSSQIPGTFHHDPAPLSLPLHPPDSFRSVAARWDSVEIGTDTEVYGTGTAGLSSTRPEFNLARRRSQYLARGPSGPAIDPVTKDIQLRVRKASAASTQSNTVRRKPAQDGVPSAESDSAPRPQTGNFGIKSSISQDSLRQKASSASLRNRRETSGNGPTTATGEDGRLKHPSDFIKVTRTRRDEIAAEVSPPEKYNAAKPVEGTTSLINNEPAKLGNVFEPSPVISDDDDTSVSAKKRRVGSGGIKVQRSKVDDIPSDSESDASSRGALDELKTPMKRPRHVPKPLIIPPPPQPQNSALAVQEQKESPVSTIPSSIPTISTFTSPSMPQPGHLAARKVDDDLPKEAVRRGERDGNIPPIVTTAKTRNIARAAAARRFAASTAPRLGFAGVDPLGVSRARNAAPKDPENSVPAGRYTTRSRGKSRT